jgi:thiol-disulfide isomerase/thioredoxin
MDRKQVKLLVLILALAGVLGGAALLYPRLSAEVDAGPVLQESSQPAMEEYDAQAETAEVPEAPMAPDFVVYDGEGQAVRLSDLRGKPVVVNFWASWCSPCKREMPDFEDAFLTYGEDVHFMMVNMTDGRRETMETAKAFMEEAGYTFPVYYDTELSAAVTYGVNTIPASYFVDAEGHAVTYAAGILSREMLQIGLDMILSDTEK